MTLTEFRPTPRRQRMLDAVIYSVIDKFATKHGVDIFTFDQDQFDELYQKVLTYFEENNLSSPDDIREVDRLILGGYLLLA
jgi:hypothetical protein